MAVAERLELDEAEETRERVTVWDTGEMLYVHPIASLFPMMSEEELDDLAEDIRQNGQADPIVRDQHGQLIDGRNRLEACGRAKVSPDMIQVALDDPVAYILSKNVTRRHLTQGQRAMAVAKARGVHLVNIRDGAASSRLSLGIVAEAAVVLKYAPEYADAVLFRGMPLKEAYAKAQERKAAAQSDDAKLEGLKAEAPDLAELVIDERLTLAEAQGGLEERRRKAREEEARERQRRATVTQMVFEAVNALGPTGAGVADKARRLAEDLTPGRLPDGSALSRERLEACAAVLTNLASLLYGGPSDEDIKIPDQS
jgi:RNase H-fold protein (predicted Holliday junction resolvase)